MTRAILIGVFTFVFTYFLLPVAASFPITTFSLTPPDQYTDGTTIPPEDTLTYKVYCSDTPGGPYAPIEETTTLTSFALDTASCVTQEGTYYFVATATSSVSGLESDYSGETTKTYTASDVNPTPPKPGNIILTSLKEKYNALLHIL